MSYINIADPGSGNHETWACFGPLLLGHSVDNLTALDSDFSKFSKCLKIGGGLNYLLYKWLE